ncbi:hypothetical protein [Glycomyces tritici]|uniref:DUF4179 domain-containing protein n=1 Tax=Glycomyces tritici TaxID=2665176 RepID=A0ABT7YT22_9ACTN|nr:hypothetical protein [Glycomyces tritici]MDN3241413.1 hypothetical protein [Glycomyces tritici]
MTHPSPDYRRVPGASRAHILQPPGSGQPAPGPSRRRKLLALFKKPLTYVVAVVLGAALVAGIQQIITTTTAKTIEQAFTDPLFAFDVKMLEPAPYGQSGHTIPGTVADADLAAFTWDPMYYGLPTAAWTIEQGGSFAGWGQWEVVLEGKRDETVTVTDLYPTQVECADPEGGTYFPFSLQGTGEKIGLAVEIDDPGAKLKQLPLDEPLSFEPPDLEALPAFSDATTITLDRGEKEVITFTAHADEQYCEFALAVEYLADGERQTSRIAPEQPGHFAVAPVLEVADYATMVLPWMACTDEQPHAVTGTEAAAIYAELDRNPGVPVDCV